MAFSVCGYVITDGLTCIYSGLGGHSVDFVRLLVRVLKVGEKHWKFS